MRFNQYDNDSRFWLTNTSFGKWVLRVGLSIIIILVLLKWLGYDV